MTDLTETIRTRLGIDQAVDWDTVYSSELPRVYNFFLYKIGDREFAQDLTATTFERAWKQRSRYHSILASPTTWLFGIARNVLKEHFRASQKAIQRSARPSQRNELASQMDTDRMIQQQQDHEYLRKMLLELPERAQDLIALKYGAGLNNRQIAKISGLSESNVGSILHRTVKNLRKRWDENHG